jgi:orotate phosphoribosyltransferase
MTGDEVWVFFYGSYMNRAVLAEVELRPAQFLSARVSGFDVRIAPRANLVRAPGCTVFGALATATHAELERLYAHARDVLGEVYLPEAVVAVDAAGCSRPALCYVARDMRERPAEAAYVERVIAGARELGAPDDYLERLAAFLPVEARVERLLARRTGHFRLESGHHGELWLDLERLCLRPEPVRRLAAELARRLARHRVEAVCAPLVEGAFVGLFVAEALGVPFSYAERGPDAPGESLFPARYAVPRALRGELAGKRVAIANDVVNAGSAVRATAADLVRLGAQPVALGTLAVLGAAAADLAAREGLALEALAEFPNALWKPADCPLCARGVALSS